MENLVILVLAVVHLYFLYRVWTELGFLWFLACLIPFVSLFVFFNDWRLFRKIFFAELALAVILMLVR